MQPGRAQSDGLQVDRLVQQLRIRRDREVEARLASGVVDAGAEQLDRHRVQQERAVEAEVRAAALLAVEEAEGTPGLSLEFEVEGATDHGVGGQHQAIGQTQGGQHGGDVGHAADQRAVGGRRAVGVQQVAHLAGRGVATLLLEHHARHHRTGTGDDRCRPGRSTEVVVVQLAVVTAAIEGVAVAGGVDGLAPGVGVDARAEAAGGDAGS